MVRQGEIIFRIAEVTKKASNRFDRERLEHRVSPIYPTTVPLSFPYLPGSSITIDGLFEGPSTTKRARHGTGKESTGGSRCTSVFCPTPSTVDCAT